MLLAMSSNALLYIWPAQTPISTDPPSEGLTYKLLHFGIYSMLFSSPMNNLSKRILEIWKWNHMHPAKKIVIWYPTNLGRLHWWMKSGCMGCGYTMFYH